MRGAEGIHDEHVAQLGHLPGQALVIVLLADIEANVLAQHDLARGNVDAVEPVGHQPHGRLQ